MAHARSVRLWVPILIGFVAVIGGYAAWVATSSQPTMQLSENFAQRQKLFDSIPGLRFTSLGLSITVGEPDPGRQRVGILAFPHADGTAGVTLANTYIPIGDLDVMLDMERVGASSLALDATEEGLRGSSPVGSLVEYQDGQGSGPIPGALQITEVEDRGLSTYPFDQYETRLLSWANVVNGERATSIPDRQYTSIPIDVSVEDTSQGTFATSVKLLSTKDVGGGPRPEGGILSAAQPLEIPASETQFIEDVRDSNAVQVYFQFERTPSTKFLALLVYGIMLMTAISVLAVTLWVAGRHKVVALSAAIWAVAVVFTILEARRILPGFPPIGGYGDLVVFFPSLAVAASCAVILILIWIRRETYEF